MAILIGMVVAVGFPLVALIVSEIDDAIWEYSNK